MVTTGRIELLFEDAHRMYEAAIECLEAGDIRDAAEKAWCATKRATDALILARTGKEPRTSGQTRRALGAMAVGDSSIRRLRELYSRQQTYLHGGCFYDGDCEGEAILSDIRDTLQYIRDAATAAGASGYTA
jgi:hypothetical protein